MDTTKAYLSGLFYLLCINTSIGSEDKKDIINFIQYALSPVPITFSDREKKLIKNLYTKYSKLEI